MNQRIKLFKTAMATRSPEMWSNYKRARNDVTRAITTAKSSYFSQKLSEAKNTTSYWKRIKRATNPQVRETIGLLKRSDGTLALALGRGQGNVIELLFGYFQRNAE